jgi:16S rRNA (guanine(527)-N(7))-methyltransferase RsmG
MFHVKQVDVPVYSKAREECRVLGSSISEETYGRIVLFLEFLADCSKRINLTGPAEFPRLWRRHVLESVAYAGLLNRRAPVVDVGTGAGFPGLILSLLGFSVVMVEPRRKRCAFLETALRECGAEASVVCGRLEETGPYPSGTQFTARAVKSPEEMEVILRKSAQADFTLFIRVSHPVPSLGGSVRLHRLPSPPLDREGFILQYSHSERTE